MKRLSLVVVMLLVAGFVAFAGGASEAEGEEEQVVLDFPSWQAEEPGFAEFWEYAIGEFESAHPNVTINLQQIPYSQFIDQMTTRFAGGNPPDITHIPARFFDQFASQGWLETIDDRLAETDIPETWTPLQESMVYNGETQGVLLMGYGYMLFYNEQMLSNAGVDVPETPQELISAVKAITNEDEGIYGWAMTTTEHPNVYVDVATFVFGQGERFIEDGEYRFTDPEVVRYIEQYREVSQYAPEGASSEFARQLLVDGKVAMMKDGPWVASAFAQAPDDIRPHLKIGKVPFPQAAGGASNSVHIPTAIDEERKELVWEFIKILTTPEAQQKYTISTRSPAPRQGVLTEELMAEYPELRAINETAETAVNTWPNSAVVQENYSLYSKIVAEAMLQLILDPSADTMEVLEDLEARLNSEIPL